MSHLSAFGHFFGFTSAINYATSIFSDAAKYLKSLLEEFEIDKLSKELSYNEQSFPLYKITLKKKIDSTTNPSEKDKLIVKMNEGDIKILETQNAKIEVTRFLNEIKNSDTYTERFRQIFSPLFPLGGTYSVIFLLLSSFSEAIENDRILCINMIIWINVCFLIICLINYFGWCGLKNKSVAFRIYVMNALLILSVLVAWIIAFFVERYEFLQILKLSISYERILFMSLVLFSCIGFFALAYKVVRVNAIAWRKFKKFKTANAIFKDYFAKMQLLK